MSSPAGRLLALLSMFQARPRWTAAELAERLGTTERTVRRDVTRLRELGYPVDAEPGRSGGYQLGRGGTLPPLLLDDDEAVAVAVGLRLATTAGLEGHEVAAVSALAKLEQVLPATLREQVGALHGSTVLLGRTGEARTDPERLLLLAQACRRQEVVHLTYVDAEGRESERRVEPFRLVHVERRWYLVAFDRTRDAWRTLRVDRVVDAWTAGHRFVRTEEPDAARLVADGVALGAYSIQAEVLLDADPEEASWEVARTVGVLEPAPGGKTLLRIAANDLDWIARYLAGLPFAATILQPPELRTAMRRVIRRLQETARVPSHDPPPRSSPP